MFHKYQPKSVEELKKEWAEDARWKGVYRPYAAEEVDSLRGTFQHDHTLARMGAERLWQLLHEEKFIRALGALTGNQAVEMVQAGLKSIYLSGWQVAGDANDALTMYPDQSLYPVTSVPTVLKKINNALIRADQIQHMEGRDGEVQYFAPIVADAEAGFGGPLNTFELVKAMIEAGAAGIHLEDQLSSLKKCGHMGGKVLVPVHDFIQKLISARLAADDYEMMYALDAAIQEIEHFVAKHMRWVAYERLRAADLLLAAQYGDAAAIRGIFIYEQGANPEARANLKAVSDIFLLNLVATL